MTLTKKWQKILSIGWLKVKFWIIEECIRIKYKDKDSVNVLVSWVLYRSTGPRFEFNWVRLGKILSAFHLFCGTIRLVLSMVGNYTLGVSWGVYHLTLLQSIIWDLRSRFWTSMGCRTTGSLFILYSKLHLNRNRWYWW